MHLYTIYIGLYLYNMYYNAVPLWYIRTRMECKFIYFPRRCCIKDPKRQNFSGVWLIAVFLINPTFHTMFSILQCPSVEKEDGKRMNVRMSSVDCFVFVYTIDDERLLINTITCDPSSIDALCFVPTYIYVHAHAQTHTHSHTLSLSHTHARAHTHA